MRDRSSSSSSCLSLLSPAASAGGGIDSVSVPGSGGGESVPEAKPDELDSEVVARVVGHYQLTESGRATLIELGAPEAALDTFGKAHIRKDGDKLMFEQGGQPSHQLFQRGTVFFSKSAGFELEFVLPEEGGPAPKVILRGAPKPIEFERVAAPVEGGDAAVPNSP